MTHCFKTSTPRQGDGLPLPCLHVRVFSLKHLCVLCGDACDSLSVTSGTAEQPRRAQRGWKHLHLCVHAFTLAHLLWLWTFSFKSQALLLTVQTLNERSCQPFSWILMRGLCAGIWVTFVVIFALTCYTLTQRSLSSFFKTIVFVLKQTSRPSNFSGDLVSVVLWVHDAN